MHNVMNRRWLLAAHTEADPRKLVLPSAGGQAGGGVGMSLPLRAIFFLMTGVERRLRRSSILEEVCDDGS